jgi:hypothetical protein
MMIDGGWNGFSTDRVDNNLSYCDPAQVYQLLCSGCNRRVKGDSVPKPSNADPPISLFSRTLSDMIFNTITRSQWLLDVKQPDPEQLQMLKTVTDPESPQCHFGCGNALYFGDKDG